jgi:hypothetical protein
MYKPCRIFGGIKVKFKTQWLTALRSMGNRSYWNKPNTVEFFAFMTKAAIIVPGLLFDTQIWWLYIIALITSLSLIWSSTVKTLPTIIWFNILWSMLAATAIIKYWV